LFEIIAKIFGLLVISYVFLIVETGAVVAEWLVPDGFLLSGGHRSDFWEAPVQPCVQCVLGAYLTLPLNYKKV
jgi:hypothetical protein